MRYRLMTAALVAAFAASTATSADPPKDAGLDIVPSTAFGFVTVRVSDLNTVEALKPVRDAIIKLEKGERSVDKLLGMSIGDIERVTLFWPALPADESAATPVVVVTTRGPFNEAKLLKALKAAPASDGLRRSGRKPAYANELAVPRASTLPTLPDRPPGFPGGAVAPKGGGVPFPVDVPKGPPGAIPTIPAPGLAPPPGLGPAPKPLGPPKFDTRIGDEPADPKPALPARGDQPVAEKETAPTVGPDLYFLEQLPFQAVFLLDDRTLVFLPSADRGGMATHFNLIGQLLRRKADGPLADALADAGKHTVTAAVRIGQVETLFREEFPRELVPFRSLLRAQVAVVTADVGAKSTVTARLTFADAGLAKRAGPVLSTLLQLGSDTVADLRKQAGNEADWGPVLLPLLELAGAALDKAEVKTDGTIVSARVEAEIGPAVAKAMAALPDLTEAASAKMKTVNNLKQIGLAMHNYHDAFGFFPTDVFDPAGKPLLSWRVQILPFIEQDQLYKQLDLTKAWDDPANAKMLEKMPDVFRVFGRDAKEKGTTYLQMPTSVQPPSGPSPFHVPGRRLRINDIVDGTSNTLMVVEAADAVPWAKPADVVYDPTKAPKVGSPDRKWFFAGYADGSVRTLNRTKLTDDQLRALMTINGGEVVTIDE